MKRTLLIFSLLVSSLSFGQSLTIVSADSSNATGDATTSYNLESNIVIKNNSSNDINVKVKRLVPNPNSLTDSNAICWGQLCYPAHTSVTPYGEVINAGQSSGSGQFVGHVYPDGDGVEMSGDITYVFYDADNPNDSVAYTITYKVIGNVGLSEYKANVVKVYPNPASNVLNVDYHLNSVKNASFELVNMVGKVVYQKNISTTQGKISLDVSSLSRGVYFYTIKANSSIEQTRKLVLQ